MTYTVVLVREEVGGYSVHVPALKGCHTQGESVPEALEMAREAIQLFVECLIERGQPVPPDVETVTFDWYDSIKASVYRLPVPEVVPTS